MNAFRNGKLVLSAVAAVALVAAGAAFAASKIHSSTPAARSTSGTAIFAAGRTAGTAGAPRGRGDDLAAAATYLGLSQSDLQTALQSGKTLAQVADATSGKSAAGLIDALVSHETAEIAQAVKDGKLTQAQADQLTADLKARNTAKVNQTGPGPGGGPRGGHGDGLAAAATYLGLSQSDLQTALQSGKTLAQVADATSGKSAAGLIDALVTSETAKIAQAVKDGKLTQAQADQITANLKARITAMVNHTGPGPDGGGRGFGPRGGGGAPPASQPPAHI